MIAIQKITDLKECQDLWQQHWPQTCLFDLWPLRAIFLEAFQRQPLFLKATRDGKTEGLLALSWIAEEGYFGHFPGELWAGKTWLEQNRIIASSPVVATELLAAIPGPFHLRYMKYSSMLADEYQEKDETNYALLPEEYNFSFASYLDTFSGKSRKKLLQEIDKLKKTEITFRFNHYPDIETMLKLNLQAYSGTSYFQDQRFRTAFIKLAAWLHKHELLHLTTVLSKGTIAAVDLGAVWKNTYTVLAGATNPAFPGIAKLINLHHLEWACCEKLDSVDFLCGDFNWKERFHLDQRPLYQLFDPEMTTLSSSAPKNKKDNRGEPTHG